MKITDKTNFDPFLLNTNMGFCFRWYNASMLKIGKEINICKLKYKCIYKFIGKCYKKN